MSLPVKLYKAGEDEKLFDQMWQSSTTVRERLVEIYIKRLEALVEDDEDVENMKNPNWTERQAFNLGKRKALRDVITDLRHKV